MNLSNESLRNDLSRPLVNNEDFHKRVSVVEGMLYDPESGNVHLGKASKLFEKFTRKEDSGFIIKTFNDTYLKDRSLFDKKEGIDFSANGVSLMLFESIRKNEKILQSKQDIYNILLLNSKVENENIDLWENVLIYHKTSLMLMNNYYKTYNDEISKSRVWSHGSVNGDSQFILYGSNPFTSESKKVHADMFKMHGVKPFFLKGLNVSKIKSLDTSGSFEFIIKEIPGLKDETLKTIENISEIWKKIYPKDVFTTRFNEIKEL